MELKNARILVTGGSAGIGLATARLLMAHGARVCISGRNEARLKEAAEALGCTWVAADVSQEAQVVNLVAEATKQLEGLDVLINNADYGYAAPLVEVEAAAFEQVWRTNVLGATLCAREAARHFIAQKKGHILNIASTASTKGSPNASPYVATKFALRGMTECWRQELRQHNIRVMLVNPSEVMTDFARSVQTPGGTRARTYTQAEQDTKLRAEEIAHTILGMLQLDDRAFITEATVFATNPMV
ncbi:MAG: SDR family oxidoreductase [Bacteroidetes bacterium]|jgi:3-oxoacyl-[acyl-carrier protein] reductase|nr:SDR family oxidoreductase [Bacteroidota bacterium]